MLGKASLAQSLSLRSPQAPSRSRFPDGASLLHFHGFDAGFDKRLTRKADAIVAEDTPLDNLLGPGLDACRARWPLVRLPCATVRLTKALDKEAPPAEGAPAAGAPPDAKKLAAAAAAAAEARTRLGEALAQAAAVCQVEAADVAVTQEDGMLCCSVQVRGQEVSVFAVVEALSTAAQDKKAFAELFDAFVQAGGAPEAPVSVAPQWPLDRAAAEVRLVFPRYEQAAKQLGKEMPRIIAASWKAHREAWERLVGETPGRVAPLLARESMACFGGNLLPLGAAQRRQLPEERPLQGAESLADLAADAQQAQRLLKEVLAEGSTWSRAHLNNPERVPRDGARRTWASGELDILPNAAHYDPGVRDEHLAFEKAKQLQRAYEATPPLCELTDLSRLDITFTSPEDASAGLDQVLARFDVVWLANRFRSPSCLGLRDIVVGVRQHVPVQEEIPKPGVHHVSKRAHISELRLRLQDLHAAHVAAEQRRLEEMRGLLAGHSVLPLHVDRVLALALKGVVCTHGQARRDADLELARAVDHFVRSGTALGTEGRWDAEDLVDELADQALEAGVDGARVLSLLQAVPELNEKRELRKRRVALMDQITGHLSQYAGLALQELFPCFLDNLAALPHDPQGRVCLMDNWWQSPQFASVHDTWRAAVPDVKLGLKEEFGELQRRAEAISEEEHNLVGQATDFHLHFATLAAATSADHLGQALIRFLLARGRGRTVAPAEVAEAAVWADAAAGVPAGTLDKVTRLLRWAHFEDELCTALQVGPRPALLEALQEALQDKESEHWGCVEHWQAAGLKSLCGRLTKREPRALPVSLVLLDVGKAEVRAQVAEAMTSAQGLKAAWVEQVIEAGALPLFANMLRSGKLEGRCSYMGSLAIRNLAENAVGRSAVSEAQLIPLLAGVALDPAAGQDVSFLALAALNCLAKGSEEDVEAIRKAGLKVDSVGRVSKKR